MTTTDGSFTNSRGKKLATVASVPKDQPIKAVVHYHHGLGGYAASDSNLFEFLAQHGFATLALDAQGHGHSEPHPPSVERAAIRDFTAVVADAAQHILEHVVPFRQQHCPDAKLFLAGSSMGGAVALLLAARPDIQQLPGFGGLILNSAAAQAKLTLIMRLELPLAGLANRLFPYAQLIPRAPHEQFCKDPAQWERRDNDPLMTISGIRVCTACAMLQAFALVRDAAPHVTCPILAVHGERDEVCRLDAVKTLLDTQVASKDKTLKTWPDAVHVMLHDPEQDEVMAAMCEWLQARL